MLTIRHPDFTLTAGPTPASARTLAALGQPLIFDYDPVFLERFRELERKVAQLFGSKNDVVLVQGEAVAGLEAAARSLTRPGTRALNLVSGVYAKWFGDWLRAYGAEVTELEVPYDQALDPEEVERALQTMDLVDLVSIVHCETPAGILNPLGEIVPLAKAKGALVIADVVSSLGGHAVHPDEWGIDVAVAAPQKCLAGPPGITMMTVSDEAWSAMSANPQAPRHSFLSLLDWKDRWIDGGRERFPYTPSVCDVSGVLAACDEVLDEGLEAVIARHERAARAIRAGVKALGLSLWPVTEEIAANCVTAVRIPPGIDGARLLALIRERYGVMLSAGYGELIEKVIRLGHMGPNASAMRPVVAVAALGRGMADLGHQVSIGAGVEATLAAVGDGARDGELAVDALGSGR